MNTEMVNIGQSVVKRIDLVSAGFWSFSWLVGWLKP